MSRLPRPLLSPDHHQTGPSLPSASQLTMITTRKRKAADEDTNENQNYPRKLPAISENNQPLRPSKNAPNATRPLTRSKASGLTIPSTSKLSSIPARRTQRATSAPPKSEPIRPPARPTIGLRATGSRVASGPLRGKGNDDQKFQALQEQVASIESARAADAARLAADMDAERAKLAELHDHHIALSKELHDARSKELDQLRELSSASDQLETLKRKHANELMDLEADIKKKERRIRELEEDLRLAQDDLDRERETTRTLKGTVSQQSTTQLTLTTQVTALQAQLTALQAALDMSSNNGSQLRLELETERKRVAELEQETQAAETLRRKLHNTIQELKVSVITLSSHSLDLSSLGQYTRLLSSEARSPFGYSTSRLVENHYASTWTKLNVLVTLARRLCQSRH